MSESRTVDRLVLAPTTQVADVEQWFGRFGVERVAVIDDAHVGLSAVLWQDRAGEPANMAVPGDVLRAVDLGGTSGRATVINGGPAPAGEDDPPPALGVLLVAVPADLLRRLAGHLNRYDHEGRLGTCREHETPAGGCQVCTDLEALQLLLMDAR